MNSTRTTTHFAGTFDADITLDLATRTTRFCAAFAKMPAEERELPLQTLMMTRIRNQERRRREFFAEHPSLASAVVWGKISRDILCRSRWIATIETVNGEAVDPDHAPVGAGPSRWLALQSALRTLAHSAARTQPA